MESPSLKRSNKNIVRSRDPNIWCLISSVSGPWDMYSDTHVYMYFWFDIARIDISWYECTYVFWQWHMYSDIHTRVYWRVCCIFWHECIYVFLIWHCTHINILTWHACKNMFWQWHMYFWYDIARIYIYWHDMRAYMYANNDICILTYIRIYWRVSCIFCILICIRTHQICILTNTNLTW